MTDWRNARIEEARSEAEATKNSGYTNAPLLSRLADAIEAAEKAHTPTGGSESERDALAKAMCTVETRSKAASLEEVQVGIQRWTRHRYEADRLIEELADAGVALRLSEGPQGEPSDSSACGRCGGTSWHHTVECFTGEPSDAQVKAAWEAYITAQEADPYDREGRMRAALRAAGEVR